ncbi:MAG: heparinase [Chloroflexi bacterium]|nr:MAG: heparinase [Chloroflexota bacterium]
MQYWHTLRWLRPVQIIGRIWFKLYRPRPDLRSAPPLALPSAYWHPCRREQSLIAPTAFRFLSVTRRIDTPADWVRPDWPKLWRYNAHYFDDLVADGAKARTNWHRMLIARWIEENPPGQGDGWEPYPTSVRLVNWLKWLLSGHPPVPGMLDSLAVQTRWLRQRLEYHLLGNHLWTNAKALIFAGTCFCGKESEQWLREGLHLMRRELTEQVLADGGHFERSPMYHFVFIEDLLDLIQLAQLTGRLKTDERMWRLVARRMLDWARVMIHPDGELSFFNDAAFNIAPSLGALQDYAKALGVELPSPPREGVHLLKASGYARLQLGTALLLADVAPVGPDYQPGHAHADTLSFELSLRERRILVNGGTSTYENNAERWRQRGTAAHNTVVVDGQNSSEVWSAFRVARRAKVYDIRVGEEDGKLFLSAWHDGYLRLPGQVRHRRHWQLSAKRLVVEDMLEGTYRQAEAHFHFAPGAERCVRWEVEAGEARMEEALWCPRFGETVPIKKLVVRIPARRCVVSFFWD